MKKIKLTQGYEATVSDEDFQYLSQWKWQILKAKRNRFYAQRDQGRIKMHREIAARMGLNTSGMDIDHRDRNGLNNTRENLRLATRSQNVFSSGARSNNTSGIKGVCWNKKRQKWFATIRVNRKARWLGEFDTKEAAAKARREAEIEAFGEFADNTQAQTTGAA